MRVGSMGDIEELCRAADAAGMADAVPAPGERAQGLSVELACALGLAPRYLKKGLLEISNSNSAKWGRVKRGTARLHPNSLETWWLALSWVCRNDEVSSEEFLRQVEDAIRVSSSSRDRLTAAWNEQKRLRVTGK